MSKLAIFLILVLGLTLAVSLTQAKEDQFALSTDIECKKIGFIESYVQETYGEIPFIESKIFLQASKNGRLYEGNLVTYTNPKTRTYTLVVQFAADRMSCVLGIGTDLAPARTRANT
jgi:hypothetical protein